MSLADAESKVMVFVVRNHHSGPDEIERWAARMGYLVANTRRLDPGSTRIRYPDGTLYNLHTPDTEIWGADILLKDELHG